MNFTMLLYETPEGFARRTDPDAEKREAYHAAWPRYVQALSEAGVFVTGAGLQPPGNATTVTIGDPRRVQDGPYADTKEQLGGFFMIDVPNLDAALEWAARIPAAPGCVIEVRPNMVPG
ncbi:YciI family protein [Paraburkholderia sp. GAS334]|uniref:YciI family protein n=1 Tax=unclassified Paraburkholderia TaxID=2615204 RepID=UPI003D197692